MITILSKQRRIWQEADKGADGYKRASLTVEAALVLPLFLFVMIAFIYFIQIMTVQEHIQESITGTGLSLAKLAYVYDDFLDAEEAENYDFSVFGEEYDIDLKELSGIVLGEAVIKTLVKKELDTDQINHSCIKGGFRDISFYYSRILEDEDCIDIVARYYVSIPVWFFGLEDMRMIQRVRVRGWTGHQVPARYTIVKEEPGTEEATVYITETGTVYHLNKNCSHLKLSIEEVTGIPDARRNRSGGKYYPCETCCDGERSETGIYYITDYGDRYHTSRECPGLKRTIREVPLSEVSGRTPCKRCGQ
jgi:hypothetical protein